MTTFDHKYGLKLSTRLTPMELELLCFECGIRTDQGGLGKFGHLKEAIKIIYPNVQWNAWLEAQLRSLCTEEYAIKVGSTTCRFVSWTGCGAAGKTYAACLFACLWFMCDPHNSIVDLTSTTKDMVGKRIWPEIQSFFQDSLNDNGRKYSWGHMIDSSKILQAVKGDSKHSISALAVGHGETLKAIENLKGRHAKRVFMVIDEANKTAEAIFRTVHNKVQGCQDLTVLIIGNAVSKLDNHGRACEPLKGWGTVSVADESWPTRGVPEWNMGPGLCLHFDGFKSPNVIASKTVYPFIYTYENFLRDTKGQGERSLDFWSQSRGFWPSDSSAYVVITEQMVEKYDGYGEFTFYSRVVPMAFLDSAFGGDDCVLQFAEMGDLADGTAAIQLKDQIVIEGNLNSPDELDYQIARRCISECKERKIGPKFFGVYSTGIGRGVAAILATEWSPEIVKIEEGGAPSDMPASSTDSRPAKDVYDRRVTELWYSVREFLTAGQIKGFYREAVVEFASRLYELRNRKIYLETKDECKVRLGHSPDHADPIAGLCELARQHGASPSGMSGTVINSSLDEAVKKSQEVLENAYAEPTDWFQQDYYV